LTQGNKSIAIGANAGSSNQSSESIAIGANAGDTAQGNNSVAIGNSAGLNSQGNYSVAIGNNAGYTGQHSNTIVINASADQLNTVGPTGLYINPIREDTTGDYVLSYNTGTAEVTYIPLAGAGSTGPTGPTGTAGSQIYYGSGFPPATGSNADLYGVTGDFYLDTDTGILYVY